MNTSSPPFKGVFTRLLEHPPADITDDRLLRALEMAMMEVSSEEAFAELKALVGILNERKKDARWVPDSRYQPTGDWQDQKQIHRILGEVMDPPVDGRSVAQDKWDYVERVLSAWRQVRDAITRPSCFHCNQPIHGRIITCLDCKAPLHEHVCAASHFWPSGRPCQT